MSENTGPLPDATHVSCRPDPLDPSIIETRHRAVCVTKPYPGCITCPHSRFELVFTAQPQDMYEVIQCPRWGNEGHRYRGYPPDYYQPVERAMCLDRPFQFCSICPSQDELVDIGADKVRPGWYGRWRRFTKVED